MKATKTCIFLLLLVLTSVSYAQKKTATVTGKVLDENENPLSKVSVTILGRSSGVTSNDSGYFSIKVPAEKAFALIFTYTSYRSEQRNFFLNENEKENIVLRLERGSTELQEITVKDDRIRTQASGYRINPKNALLLPSATGGVEGLIKIFTNSNNELSSQYSVRGGNYDENLIYVNDFEVYRPYLVRQGQQEGLSFINAEMVRNLNFYNGGFQARFGDKMSSVLDIQYKQPKKFGGSAYVSLLEQGLHFEGGSKDEKVSFVIGGRNRSNQNLLSSQQTKGNYVPSSNDVQGYITYQPNSKWQFEAMMNYSRTQFKLTPEYSSQTASVFSPFFTANLGLDIYFAGGERDRYSTAMAGIATTYQPTKNLKLKWMLSHFSNNEEESFDIQGAYLFGERDFDRSRATFGLIVNPLGAGVFQNFARNRLNIATQNATHKGSLSKGKHFFQWGHSLERQTINDQLNEWELTDSAGYTLPFNPNQLQLSKVIKSKADLTFFRTNGYVQDNYILNDSMNMILQVGVRYNYNTLNNEVLVQPRVQFSMQPLNGKDIVFRAAAGAYHQPPFYRELRRYDGSVNEAVKAQKSWQVVAGIDYNFKGWGNRPFKLQAEAYYKHMYDIVPYDVDNVRIRYFGSNSAKAYATGIEARLFGELVKDAESWLSIGLMRTRENLDNDQWYNYKLDSLNRPIDSTLVQGGWIRRPTDRFLSVGLFYQDYLSTNKNFKFSMSGLYGTNLPYNIPNSVKYRNALTIDPYIRVDFGFSALLLDGEKSKRRSRNPFREFNNIWASLEVFNVIDRPNTISYLLIKDFSNTIFSIPNRLTPRLVNFKIVARW
ncbi:TonB-dependent receptor [Lacibacter luteus]|uniref:TonB-dependent receptor n=1 Tax=Lacibacter luteus TaxID=2508719 RepID=A0A4Q1CNR7_9BACT|nr:TonB-dependent receptor [Lacibacter luteus]RXK62743.1 TonB-dependent receptor [Lacibacter luteus]